LDLKEALQVKCTIWYFQLFWTWQASTCHLLIQSCTCRYFKSC